MASIYCDYGVRRSEFLLLGKFLQVLEDLFMRLRSFRICRLFDNARWLFSGKGRPLDLRIDSAALDDLFEKRRIICRWFRCNVAHEAGKRLLFRGWILLRRRPLNLWQLNVTFGNFILFSLVFACSGILISLQFHLQLYHLRALIFGSLSFGCQAIPYLLFIQIFRISSTDLRFAWLFYLLYITWLLLIFSDFSDLTHLILNLL